MCDAHLLVSTLCSRSINTREGIIIKALDCAAAAANRDALAKTVYARLFDWYFLLQYYISHVMPYFKGLIISIIVFRFFKNISTKVEMGSVRL